MSDAIPEISVLMPVHNGKAYLEEAVNNVLEQTCPDLELIAVDDGSTDGSTEILEDLSNKDPRITIIRNSENMGLTRSLIRAAGAARGGYLARQDADDISLPPRLESQLVFLKENPSYGAVGTSALIIDRSGNVIRNTNVPTTWFMARQILRFGNCFVHGSMMIRKDVYDRSGGYRGAFSVGQDFDLWLRISKLAKLRNLKERLYKWRETGDNISLMKTDTQFKSGALALYDHRYNRNLELHKVLDIDAFINDLSKTERRKYDSCLRLLCLRHGNMATARKYLEDSLINRSLLAIMGTAFRLLRPS